MHPHSRRFPNDPPLYVDDFKRKLQDLTVDPPRDDQGWQAPSFVLAKSLTSWLESPATPNNSATRAAFLLDRCFPDQDILPILEQYISTCPLMFCILLEMDCGPLVVHFHRIGLIDARLPMPLNKLHGYIKRALQRGTHEVDILAHEFDQRQWKYFPLEFSHDMQPLPLDQQMILPICERIKAGEGGTAEVYKITIPEEFVDVELRNAVSCSIIEYELYGRCYQFALKNFHDNSLDMRDNEITAYSRLHDQEYVIKCHGGFSHYDRNDVEMTHSILLEYGRCDLLRYFRRVDPPDVAEDVESFWSALFNVVKAVKYIHDYTATRVGREENYDGWHGDIKPENILMTERAILGEDKRYRRVLKLADPGFMNFVRSSKTQNAHGPPHKLRGYTSTYGPPEVNEKQTWAEEPWAVDMWSLGCVLSEAATWIVLSYGGLAAYNALRTQAAKGRQFLSPVNPVNAELGIVDFFHDGRKVLPTVRQWHNLLRSKVRRDDIITEKILDLVDTHLLVEQPNRRMRAGELCSKLDTILERASQNRQQDPTPAYFQQVIRDAKKKALEACDNPSQILDELQLEDHRAYSSAMSAILTFMDGSGAPIQSRINPIDSRHSRVSTATRPETLVQEIPVRTPERHPQPPPPEVRLDRAATLPQANTIVLDKMQTVFDVHYDRQKEKKKFDLFNRADRNFKDEQLASYYHKRDIVFLVDNAGSMLPYWSEVKFVLNALASKARNQDEDGMDLMFTQSPKEITNATKDVLIRFAKAISDPEVEPQINNAPSFLGEKLHDLLFEWFHKFDRNPKTKRMTIIVLTNGQWCNALGTNEFEIDNIIVNFGLEAKKLRGFETKTRPVSIQFVSFGDDPSALARLQRLDDALEDKGILDIVDTEKSTGDVYKMLLGSFIEGLDSRNAPQPSSNGSYLSPTASSTNYSYGQNSGSSFSTSQGPYSTPRTTNSSLLMSSPPPSPLPTRTLNNQRSERTSLWGKDHHRR